MINVEKFIAQYITKRTESFFKIDIENNNDNLIKAIENKSVMVIGGAGSIGSSFIKALLKYKPKRLFVIDFNENGLTELTRDLRSTFDLFVPEDYKTYPLNFDDPIFDRILEKEGPFDIIANFAAHKHVRSEKDAYSVAALLDNNVLKAEKFLAKLILSPPKHFFGVSSDKSANPVNVLGASKKIMEEMILGYSNYFPVTLARFANVAFSNGSLLDGFVERLAKKQPFSAPMDVKRYFVSPEESGQICLLACILGNTGEIFFPKLDPSQMMTFSDIGTQLLVTLGYTPRYCESEEEAKEFALSLDENSKEYPVYYWNSDTSGEKSYEEFYIEKEDVDFTKYHSLGVVKNAQRRELNEIHHQTNLLQGILNKPNVSKSEIISVLQRLLPTFHHIETGKNLDQKM
ncbi:MAG: polysaccharide biosynthesis protein [Bacteroidales bacterium]|nr:polysaccharide biosynthesis protein [Bacteroidales bacterium]